MTPDFLDMLRALSDANAEFLNSIAPNRIDILTDVSGVAFADAWPRRITLQLHRPAVPVIGLEDFIANKRATGRLRDLAGLYDLKQTAP